jgi:hypothetical protein
LTWKLRHCILWHLSKRWSSVKFPTQGRKSELRPSDPSLPPSRAQPHPNRVVSPLNVTMPGLVQTRWWLIWVGNQGYLHASYKWHLSLYHIGLRC